MKTIDKIKEKHQVSEELKNRVKNDGKINRSILNCLKEKEKTIPVISTELNMDPSLVTYYLMTLMKYGKITAGEPDEMDEYYYYKLNQ
ncbi:MAG: hypothetical protein K9G58_12410 [Bacteroidales bacterium]|nr:hypothetical protein [Bacteroidales bacterium]MCF8386763.1 hypothetical protein [Bacteroidales bacterium]MCF8398968.1 hypothetical protein [Bacteroidales bacterium]